MPKQNLPILKIAPGVKRNTTRYAAGNSWYNANQVRWRDSVLVPIGGWSKILTFSAATTAIRRMFTWKDDLTMPWLAAGSSDKLFGVSYNDDGTYTDYDITPASLGWNPGGIIGFGRDDFGSGFFGLDGEQSVTTASGLWSLDNFGKLLVAVHSQDGRLVSWDPVTPSTVAAQVTNSPTGNLLVIASEQEHLFVMGGASHPRRVQWCSRREIGIWTAAEDNSAGGFDLQSNGSILAATRVQGGILVLTDADVHLIEYVGPPNYYSRRRISDEGGIIGRYAYIPALGGAIWMDHKNFWSYIGGAVQKFECDVQDEVFVNSNFSERDRIHVGINEDAQELWFMYPSRKATEPDNYVSLSYSQEKYWSMGSIPRTSWVNPVWQTQPLACNGTDLYVHETGMLADGESRAADIFAETGALELGNGESNLWVDRIYHDSGADMPDEDTNPDAFRIMFVIQQAPAAPKRYVGPLALTNPKGYTTTRFRARQMYMRVQQYSDEFWKMGNIRVRVKEAGGRR